MKQICCQFSSKYDLKGILNKFQDAFSISDPDHLVSCIMKYNNDTFFNYFACTPKSESYSFIKFDFGPSKLIDLYSYYIKQMDIQNINFIIQKHGELKAQMMI